MGGKKRKESEWWSEEAGVSVTENILVLKDRLQRSVRYLYDRSERSYNDPGNHNCKKHFLERGKAC